MRYNPDQQKYSEVKSDKKKEEGSENDQPNTGGNIGTDGTRIDPGFFNYKQMMDSFFNFQPDKDDDEGRALKYSYMGNILNRYRKNLLKGNRDLNPCKTCNADGEVYGSKHASEWSKKYNIIK